MRNLFRMDCRRMFTSRSFRVCLGILLFFLMFIYVFLFGISNPSTRKAMENMKFEIVSSEGDVKDLDSIGDTSFIGFFNQAAVSGGFFSLVSGILATLFLCAEYSSGYIKNVFSVYQKKWKYVLSKLLCLCITNLVILTAGLLLVGLMNLIFQGYFAWDSLGDVLAFAGCVFLLENGFCALVLAVCMLTRSEGAGVAVTMCVGGGVVGMLLGYFFGSGLLRFTLYGNLSLFLPLKFDGVETIRSMAMGVIFTILYGTAALAIVKKRDV